MVSVVLSVAVLALWLYLMIGHGGFWLANQRDDRDQPAAPARWPAVTAVIPARNEADSIGECITSLLRQDYAGPFAIVLVDDQSSDATADIARRAAAAAGAADRLTVVPGRALPPGWTGKLWAVSQGVARALERAETPDYLLFTDADIAYEAGAVARLVARAEAGGYVLTSLMAKLRCESFAERALVPAFIFFFQMLYPFAWVGRRERATAAAAGGCMLVRPQALAAAGGIEAIRGALIDDCAMGRVLKRQGPVWLGLTDQVHSIRAYPRIEDIRRMVARSAYAQLRYSPLLLLGTVLGMIFCYLSAPLLALFASGAPRLIGVLVWLTMAVSFQPVLRLYGRSPLWGLALPAIALAYMAFTLDSAYQHGRGRGGLWKGRVQAEAARQQ
jgi:hopene-associated glycosyltransferase HpnB